MLPQFLQEYVTVSWIMWRMIIIHHLLRNHYQILFAVYWSSSLLFG